MSGKLYQLSPHATIAESSDLPYGLPSADAAQDGHTDWVYDGVPEGATDVSIGYDDVGKWTLGFTTNGVDYIGQGGESYEDDISLSLTCEPINGSGSNITVTATRAPRYALLDRTCNRLTLGSGTERAVFRFPAKTQGKARDFMLRLVITGSTVPEIGFVESDGTTEVAFDADDDSWADIEQGVNILMFTDTQEASA